MGDSLERRRETRVEVSIPVEVRDDNGFTLHSTRDLSTGGVFFDRAIPHAVGGSVELEFRLPGDNLAIRCSGHVVNVPDANGYGMGIHFVFLKEADRARIEAFVQQKTPGAFMKRVPWVLCLALWGCIKDTRATRDRGQGLDNVPEYPAPEKDRCAGHANNSLKTRCEEAKYLAQTYVKKLGAGDMVCLEGGFGQEPGGACLARARVEDIDQLKVLLDVKEARPDSRWFNKESHQFWFFEGALVDLYLAEHGY